MKTATQCGCTAEAKPETTPVAVPASQPKTQAGLEHLIPIAMVIVGGCEPCAEKMVLRALQEGSSWRDVDKTVRIVAGTQKMACFAQAVGAEVIARMEKPLAAARRTLEQTAGRAH